VTGTPRLEERLPWRDLLLSGAFTLVLFLFGWASAYVGNAIAGSAQGTYTFVGLTFFVVVAFLVYYAYPGRERRWYHFAGFEACVVVPIAILVPLIYLPWRIVRRREQRPST
jgi:hypothetical protein